MSLDGTGLDVADTPENERRSAGRVRAARGRGAFPQLRLVALAECGTHAMFAVAMGAYGASEQKLAEELSPRSSPGMLVLADRGFYRASSCFPNARRARARTAAGGRRPTCCCQRGTRSPTGLT